MSANVDREALRAGLFLGGRSTEQNFWDVSKKRTARKRSFAVSRKLRVAGQSGRVTRNEELDVLPRDVWQNVWWNTHTNPSVSELPSRMTPSWFKPVGVENCVCSGFDCWPRTSDSHWSGMGLIEFNDLILDGSGTTTHHQGATVKERNRRTQRQTPDDRNARRPAEGATFPRSSHSTVPQTPTAVGWGWEVTCMKDYK